MSTFSELMQKEQSELALKNNTDYVARLRIAIKENTLENFFNASEFTPRYVEITEILLFFPDAEALVLGTYEYFVKELKPFHLVTYLKTIKDIEATHHLIARDANEFINRVLSIILNFSYSIISLIIVLIEIKECELIVLSRLDEIFENTHSLYIFELYKAFINKTYYQELILESYSKYFLLAKGSSLLECLKELLKISPQEALLFIKNNFETIIVNLESSTYEFLRLIKSYQCLYPLIQEKVDFIIDNSTPRSSLSIFQNLDETLNLGLKAKNDIIDLLLPKLSTENKCHVALGALIKSHRNEYLKTILNNLLAEEQVTDFQGIGANSWSNIVFKIGTKVLKLGWIRNNPNCEKHYRILNPQYFEIIKDEEGYPIFYIEIQDYLKQDGISLKDIEDFYTDIERDGLIYIDPRGKSAENFGFLPDSKNIGSESFKKKALVLIDRDFVWKKNDPNIVYMNNY